LNLVKLLDWDSSFFGFPVGMVKAELVSGKVEAAVREADAQKLRCTYLLVPARDPALLDEAQKHGFLVRDVRIELERSVLGHPAAMDGLRHGTPDDLQRLRPIASDRFKGTRFFADDGFSAERSAELYVEWLRQGLQGESGWVTLVTNDVHGFVVCQLSTASGTGRIGLIGVASDAAGQGVGSALLAGAGALFSNASLVTATVVTQGHNVAAQRLYQSHGYRTATAHIWLHRWRPYPQ
jgi:dTDP-4-amino-4,6-dideoxy-D-galactose acyltransferase